MDPKQLLTVGDNSTSPSASQLWFHIANVAIICIYVFVGVKIGLLINAESLAHVSALVDSLIFFTGVISGILTTNKFANVFINLRYANKDGANIIQNPDSK